MSDSVNAYNQETVVNISDDFFHGNTKAGLDRLRTRLLDLTNRNRLLHFRHSKKSSLRVVDELPNVLFNRLLDGDKLVFKPVPEPKPEEYLPLETAGMLPKEGMFGEGDDGNKTEEHEANLGPFGGSRKPTAKQHAEKLGIATSYDLPESENVQVVPLKHQDKYIQTLHYPPELESILRRISSSARTAIEESGTNMLYFAFGFLEWYDTDTSTQEHFAPLLMLPVSIAHGKPSRETGLFEYTIEYSGEDIVPNLSLVEKLKRDFSLDFPSLEDDDTPETFFTKFNSILTAKPHWKVRRHITLALLYFGKLLMYRDLDPKTWPAGAELTRHPRIREFFEGTKRDSLSFSEEYQIDSPALKSEVPLLIYDADSSQHSALIDALKEKNLVISGPPGTGKSQTITNLIAAALFQGKTVLFVSEKLAALEVVRRRLDEAGLGIFCLELHSHKTQKKEFLEDLDRRIKAKGNFSDPKLLDEKLKLLERSKQQLISYVELINSRYGALDLSVFDIIWGRERFRKELACDPSLVELIFLDGTERLSFADFETNRQILDSYGKQISAITRSRSSLKEHPWYGIQNPDLDYLEERELIQKIHQVKDCIEALVADIKEFSTATGYLVELNRDAIIKLTNLLPHVPRPIGTELHALLPNLVKMENRGLLRNFTRKLEDLDKIRNGLTNGFTDIASFDPLAVDKAYRACERATELKLSQRSLQELRFFADNCEKLKRHFESLSHFFEEAITKLGCQIPYNLDAIGKLVNALASVLDAPLEDLPLRHPDLQQESAVLYFKAARDKAAQLLRLRSRLLNDFLLVSPPSPEELNRHAATLERAGIFARLFSSDYKDAKRCFELLSRKREQMDRIEMADALRDLVGFLEKLKAFENNLRYRSLPGFDGLDTPFDQLNRLLNWYEAVRGKLPTNQPTAHALLEALFKVPSQQLRLLHRWINNESEAVQGLENINSLLISISDELPDSLRARTDRNLAGLANGLGTFASDIYEITSTLSELHIREDIPVKDAPEALKQFAKYHEMRRALNENSAVSALLGEHFAGDSTDQIRLNATIALAETLARCELPIPLKNWLFAQAIVDRVNAIESEIITIKNRHDTFSACYTEVINRGDINVSFWYEGFNTDPHNPCLDSARDRIFSALFNQATLSEWSDFLRIREKVKEAKLDVLIHLVEEGKLRPEHLPTLYKFAVYNSLTRRILQDHPRLMQFTGLTHEDIRMQFVQYDLDTTELYRQRVASVIDKRHVPEGISTGPVRSWTNLALIKNEIQKQKRHIPIRQLVNRAGGALKDLKPCFMMGPLSVAQYLEPGHLKFDLVVMDEASQLKPEDALGAIARGSQVVVVGDRNQLPPTTFFERMFGDGDINGDEEDTSAVEDAESILDISSVLYQPIRQLRWHYRSRHGSLIAFSNKEFYGGELIVFPSPIVESPTLGVKYEFVADGVYENRRNRVEAERIVHATLDHMENHPGESLGVVTLNSDQRDLIEELLFDRIKRDPFAQRYLEARLTGAEPFFVKNLETVQGDERDCIFISVTYGRDSNGNLYQRFGPINGVTGHRRLNVLFTRAKNRTVVFTSMSPEDIRIDPGSQWGVRSLKGYLSYAKTGILEHPIDTAEPPANHHEIAVGNALKACGLDIVPQVGVAGYFIDIAVRHPNRAGAFILGVEFDGATYHSGKSARDRDRLREDHLKKLGWKIHRIWSTDWFKNSEREIKKVLDHIDEILKEEEGQAIITDRGLERGTTQIPSEPISEIAKQPSQEKRPAAERPSQAILTTDEARKQLIDLRENIIKQEFPKADPSKGLLRKTMLETLLIHRPTTREAWNDRIPEVLRNSIDEQQMKYLPQVLATIAQISD